MTAGRRHARGTAVAAAALAAVGFVAGSAIPGEAQELPRTSSCVSCHLAQEDSTLAAPARDYPADIHARRGFGCLVCHGGPRTAGGSLDPGAGFLAAPSRTEIPALCGRCHSDAAFMRDYNPGLRVDQVQEYYTSGHGRRLAASGDPDVATCVSCHPAHRILPPEELESSVHPLHVGELCASCHADASLMEARGLDPDVLEAYGTSVHGRLLLEEGDVSAPVCNDCHGNHGAAPPGVASVRNVCGQCHTVMADFFRSSGHLPPFDEAGLPGCATCHGHHAVQVTADADLDARTEVCRQCHTADDEAGDAFLDMGVLLDSLERERERAHEILLTAENAGMEVSAALFELEAVGNALTMARSAVHSFEVEAVATEVAKGLAVTEGAVERGVAAMEEHSFRRVGLGVSAAIIVVLIAALLLRLRELEAAGARGVEPLRLFLQDHVFARVTPYEGPEHDAAAEVAAWALLLEVAAAEPWLDATEAARLRTLVEARTAGSAAARLPELIAAARRRGGRPVVDLLAGHLSPLDRVAVLGVCRRLLDDARPLTRDDRTLLHRLVELLALHGPSHPAPRTPGPRSPS